MSEADGPPSGYDDAHAGDSAGFTVVGIGASAGGLEAFKDLLQALPANTGMAFILVIHLPASHESMMSEILARFSSMPVIEAHGSVQIEPDHIYVLAAGTDADLRAGRLVITPREAPAGRHHSIDHVLHSLAESVGPRAIGVILSGSAGDGTLGIQEIKAAGGITFAQDESAHYSSMPQSAIATGAVDFILGAGEIGRELGRIAHHPLVATAAAGVGAAVSDLGPVLEILRESANLDFTQYKRNTLYRRIARRVVLHRLHSLEDYVQMLREDPAEVQALSHDILINVTSFFRNPAAYEVFKSDVFARMTVNRSRHDPVRVWVLACSTGEEAYSLAMAFAEFCDTRDHPLPLQIFATDVNEASIVKARLGVYSRSAVQHMSPDRLSRFFVEVDGSYQIVKSIRERCVFARHNVLSDPPFSRVDLVSCRNLLIYLDSDLQQKLIRVMHYGLRPGGYLWLGASETIGTHHDLFENCSARHKIYLKKGGPTRLVDRPSGELRPGPPHARTGLRLPDARAAIQNNPNDVDRILAARYGPPSVLIREDLEILQFRGNTTRYFAPAPGRATLHLLKMVREELVMGVRAAVQEAKTREMPARHEGLRLKVDGRQCEVDIEVIPVRTSLERADLFMVVFEDGSQRHVVDAPPVAEAVRDGSTGEEIRRLQQELAATREYLQSVIEQQESANEALQAANEEVQSANEELQSINEELETSKEEVQSSNEELATVNDELHARNVELAKSNNDFLNLLSSVQLPIVMLGADLRIRRFTPAAETLLKLIPSDIGRPLSDIRLDFDLPDLEGLISESIAAETAREREVQDSHGCWFLLRIRPYRTFENRITGAVVALIDIDGLKRSQETLRQQTELLNRAYEPIIMWEIDGGITFWNAAATMTYGYAGEQALGHRLHALLESAPSLERFQGQLEDQGYWTGDLVHTRRDGQKIVVESRMVMAADVHGRKLVVQADRPVTEREKAEGLLRRLTDQSREP